MASTIEPHRNIGIVWASEPVANAWPTTTGVRGSSVNLVPTRRKGRSVLMGYALAFLAALAASSAVARDGSPSSAPDVRDRLIKIVNTAPQPLAIAMAGPVHAAAASQPLTPRTPMRIASNTKTFVAATILRLWEQHKIALDAPISSLIAPESDRLLTADGYDTKRITVRHLLSHSAGLYDAGSDPRFVQMLKTNKTHHFARPDLVRLMTEYADPQSAPGTRFQYSDTGYVLLGEIIERKTGLNLAQAVRRELKLDTLGLKETWWEIFEKAPPGAKPRARQFLGDLDVTDVDASMDLYGGGGLVMSPRDLAIVFQSLLGGKIFHSPASLREMLWKGPHEGADGYRLGIFVKHTPAGDIWWHSGFWGTYAAYAPSTRTSIAAFSDHQSGLKSAMPDIESRLLHR